MGFFSRLKAKFKLFTQTYDSLVEEAYNDLTGSDVNEDFEFMKKRKRR